MKKIALVISFFFFGMSFSFSQYPVNLFAEYFENEDYTGFRDIEEALKTPNEVYLLDLEDQGLTQIPKEVFLFPNLKGLNLKYNDLTSIPDSIHLLKNLKVLSFAFNSIDFIPNSIPNSIASLTNLEYFDFIFKEVIFCFK